jgi:dipeptidyl aminopeptidase/acylaminoacyl peptidase
VEGVKLCPVIALFHGGPEGQSKPNFSTTRQLLIDAGFIWVEPNVRGSDGYGKKWLDANGASRLNVITDIEDLSLFIKKKWAINGVAPKIGAYGGSYGGYSVYMAMTRFAGAYDAGVSVVGMSNLISFLMNTAPYRRQLRITEYGDPVKDREALEKLSPMSYFHQIKAPLMIIHGANDPRVPAGEAIQIYEMMESKGVPGKLILFPDEGHGIVKRKNRALYFSYVDDFFKENLK